MTRFAAVSLGVALVLCAFTTCVVFGQRRSLGSQGQIVFEMGQRSYSLYAMRLNSSFGEAVHTVFDPQLVFTDRFVTGVDCSPDRKSLVFWYVYLYRFDLEDGALARLVLGAGLSQLAVWSHDGARIAYVDDTGDRQPREIFTVDPDGSNVVRVTTNAYQETSLSWSPDNRRIAFTYSRLDKPDVQGLAIADSASGSTSVVYETAARLDHADWSPDGSRIAFDMGDSARRDIYTIQPDGSALTRLTGGALQNIIPHWSPSSALISYSARDSGGHYGLYVMDADGSAPYLLFLPLPGEDVFNRCWLS